MKRLAQRWGQGLRLLLAILPLTLGPVVMADQDDPRLDDLFARLQQTDDAGERHMVEMTIRHIWTLSGRQGIDRLMDRGSRAMARQDYPTALKALDQVVVQAPEFAEGWNRRATVHYLQGDMTASMVDIQRTLSLEPRHFGALSGMGLIFIRLGDFAAALEAFREVLRIHPHSATARVQVERLQQRLRERTL